MRFRPPARAFLLIAAIAGSLAGCYGRADLRGGPIPGEPLPDASTPPEGGGEPIRDAAAVDAGPGDAALIDAADGGLADAAEDPRAGDGPAPDARDLGAHADAADGPAALPADAADAPAPGDAPDPDGPPPPDAASPDGPVDPDGPIGADAADAAPDATPDLPADGPPLPPVEAYHRLLDEQWTAWSTRWTACFGTPAGALLRENSPLADDRLAAHELALRRGLIVLDDARARACLEALRTLPCEGIATNAFATTCGQALVGQVARGGFCFSPQDCRNPAADDCQQLSPSGCTARCTARAPFPAIGESCDQSVCAADAACYIAPGQLPPTRCHALTAEGTTCHDQVCVPGAWCLPATADMPQGTCRKVIGGGACQGSWQCPFPYACVFASGATTGVCAPGRGLGEVCALHGLDTDSGPFSDCASGLTCYPDAGAVFRCGLGRELGQSCEDLDVGARNALSVACRQGACNLVGGAPVCRLPGAVGADCDDDLPCAPALICGAQSKCRDPRVGLGQTCDTEGSATCPAGARCALAAGSTTNGTCVGLKKAGEACAHPDDCEPGVGCAGGICGVCQ